MFSQRGGIQGAQNRLTQARQLLLAEGRRLRDLTLSNPTHARLCYPWGEIHEALRQPGVERYQPEPLGLMLAREAAAQWHDRRALPTRAEQIIITASTSEAYSLLFKLFCDPDDEVLVPAPSYPLFAQLCRLECVRAVPYRLRHDGQWHMAHGELAQRVTEHTRALVVVHPNNPTGSFLTTQDVPELVRLGLPVISDEVFADYALQPGRQHWPSVRDRALPSVTLHGLSKAAGLPQLKLAWMCLNGPEAFQHEVRTRLEHIADAYLSAATPVQLALPRLLALAPSIQAEVLRRCRSNLKVLHTSLGAASPLSLLAPEAGWYAVLRLPDLMSEEQWALTLLQHDSLVTHPGYFYDFEGGPFLVLSLLTPSQEFEAGLRQLSARVEYCVRRACEPGTR